MREGMTKALFTNHPIDHTLAGSLLNRLDSKYAPAFERLPENERHRAALYFLPHTSTKEIITVTRPRIIKWYCPFADQTVFPSGVRYSMTLRNVTYLLPCYNYAKRLALRQKGASKT